MEKLKQNSGKRIAHVKTDFKRFLYYEIDWKQLLTVILGHRGAGKTTLLLQRMKEHPGHSIYLSLDNIYFEANRLIHLIDVLYADGYRAFFLDEVHRYKHWSKDLKNAYDNYPDIRITATGSSILDISKGQEDLSRRAVVYHLPGLSYREYLQLAYQQSYGVLKLETILQHHHETAADYHDRTDIMKTFREYLRYGYYPFFKEGLKVYSQKLFETTGIVLDIDIVSHEELTYTSVRNMKKLLYVISQSVPFKPNISRMSEKLGLPRNSILKMLDLLEHSRILSLLRSDTTGVSFLQKPEKIYLQNPNLLWTLSGDKPETGSVRETFFLNQLQTKHKVTSSRWADFMVDDLYTFEIGGSGKTRKQIKGIPNAFIAADGIKGGHGNKIPLWLFGFLY